VVADDKPTYTKEQLIEAAWEKGHLKYKLKKHQIPLYDKIWQLLNGEIEANSYILSCARRFGKSFVMVLVAIEFAIRFPNSQIRFALPVATQYAESHLPAISLIIADAPDSFEIEHLKSEKRITFGKHGSMIKFAGTDDGNGEQLRGGASNLNLLDEAGYMMDLNHLFNDVMYPMTWTTKGKSIFASTPPKKLDHDFVEIYRKHKADGLVSEFTIDDNTSISDEMRAEIIEQYGGVDSISYKREALCQFIAEDELSLTPEWKDEYEQVYPRSQYFSHYNKYSGLDFGVKDLTAALFGYYDYENAKLIIEGEVTMNGPDMTTDLLAKDIKAKIAELAYPKLDYMVADNNNLHLVQDLSITHKLFYAPVVKTSLDAMINKVRILIKQGKIIVHPSCTQLLGCLKYGVWKSKDYIGKEFGKSKKYGHFDALAALIYLCRVLDTTTNPIPMLLNVDVPNTFIPKQLSGQSSETGKKLTQALLPNRARKSKRWSARQ
jgi:hypothetical protein